MACAHLPNFFADYVNWASLWKNSHPIKFQVDPLFFFRSGWAF
jgi:hypothetical protein